MVAARVTVAVLVVALGVACAMTGAEANCRLCAQHPQDYAAFKGWTMVHNKTYYTPEEEALRFGNFRNSMEIVSDLNRNPKNSAKYDLTRFADLTQDEFREQYLMAPGAGDELRSKWVQENAGKFPPRSGMTGDAAEVKAVDWRHILTPIKNQAQCGSCWAFSTTETVETQAVVQGVGNWVLSAQQITACADGQWGNEGCQGGLPSQAFDYLKSTGMTTAAAYPYTAGGGNTGSCMLGSDKQLVEVSSQKPACSPGDESQLGAQLQESPISIGVDAQAWQFYSGGVMSAGECGGEQLDHAVQLVGYNTNQGGYWIVRNSWTASWGEQGFIYLQYGQNACGLSNTAVSIKVHGM